MLELHNKSIILLFFFSISNIEGTYSNGPSCGDRSLGYEYADSTGHCYKFHPHAESWTTANWVCAAEGGRLAVINSDVEAGVLVDLFRRYPRSAIYGTSMEECKDYVELGFYLESASLGWRTVDGQILEQAGYSKWAPDAASEGNGPFGYMDRRGMYYQGYNSIKNPFICEKLPREQCW